MSIKIVTDSTCDISLERAAALGIEIIPLKVTIDDVTYTDKLELSSDEFYKKMAAAKQMPTTTLASPLEFIEFFEKHPHDEFVGIFLSHKLSGTCQSAIIAKAELGRDNIHIIDSGSVTFGLGLLVECAACLAQKGLSSEEICRKVHALIPKLEIYAVVDTLKYLVKGGRLSGAQGAIGTLFGVKPIVRVKDGLVENVGKERGFEKALDSLKDMVDKKCKLDRNMPIAFAHTLCPQSIDSIKARFPELSGEIHEIGSVVGTHAGPGAVAIAFFNE